MCLFLISLCLFSGTLETVDGELFVGKVIRKNGEKIWLELDQGGVIVFDRKRVVSVEGKELEKKKPEGQEKPLPESESSLRYPGGGQRVAAGFPSEGKGKPSQSKANSEQNRTGSRADTEGLQGGTGKGKTPVFEPPSGFHRKESGSKATPGSGDGSEIVYVEEETGARLSFRIQPLTEGFKKSLAKVREAIGDRLLFERVFRLNALKLPARLLEWERDTEKGREHVLNIMYIKSGRLYKLSGSVSRHLLPSYRGLFLKAFKAFAATGGKNAPGGKPPGGDSPKSQDAKKADNDSRNAKRRKSPGDVKEEKSGK